MLVILYCLPKVVYSNRNLFISCCFVCLCVRLILFEFGVVLDEEIYSFT